MDSLGVQACATTKGLHIANYKFDIVWNCQEKNVQEKIKSLLKLGKGEKEMWEEDGSLVLGNGDPQGKELCVLSSFLGAWSWLRPATSLCSFQLR